MRLHRLPLILCAGIFSIFVPLAAASCSDNEGGGPTPKPDGGPDGNPPDAKPDPPPDGGPPDAGPDTDGGPNENRGVVYASSTAFRLPDSTVEAEMKRAGASFSNAGVLRDDGYSVVNDTCARTDLGAACFYFKCPRPARPESLVAGDLTIAGGPATVTLLPEVNPRGYHDFSMTPFDKPIFRGGESLVFRASGSDAIPAFEVTLTAPEPLVLMSPKFVPNPEGASILDVDRGKPLEFTWASRAAGSVKIEMYNVTAENKLDDGIHCVFPATAGKATIGTAALEKVEDAEAGINVTAFAFANTKAGKFDIRAVASVAALDVDHYQFPYYVKWLPESANRKSSVSAIPARTAAPKEWAEARQMHGCGGSPDSFRPR